MVVVVPAMSRDGFGGGQQRWPFAQVLDGRRDVSADGAPV
jgi:hypothetical protein